MKNCKMRVPGYDARAQRGWIRWELFLHDEVRDVLPTPRDDTLCVVYRGEPESGRVDRDADCGRVPRAPLPGDEGRRGHRLQLASAAA